MKTYLALALLFAHGIAAAQCTPATINPSTLQQIRPGMSLPTVTALAGCAPDTTVTEFGIAAAWHTIDQGPVLVVSFDARGVFSASLAQTFDPSAISGIGGLRVDEPKPNTWIMGAKP